MERKNCREEIGVTRSCLYTFSPVSLLHCLAVMTCTRPGDQTLTARLCRVSAQTPTAAMGQIHGRPPTLSAAQVS